MKTPTRDELIQRVRLYYPSGSVWNDEQHGRSPERLRLNALWNDILPVYHETEWARLIDELQRAVAPLMIGDATAPRDDGGFRCTVYRRDPAADLTTIVVGCVSLIAPVYTIYVARVDINRTRIPTLFFDPLPEDTRATAEIVASVIEKHFPYARLPYAMTSTPTPDLLLTVPSKDGKATLLHTLFTDTPESLP